METLKLQIQNRLKRGALSVTSIISSVQLALLSGFLLSQGATASDAVGERLLKSEADPTYESVVSLFPPFKYPRELVGVPDHPQDAGLDYLGRLQFFEDSFPLDKVNTASKRSAWVELGDPPRLIASDTNAFQRKLVDDCLPIYVLTCSKEGVEYEQTVFGYSENHSPSAELFIMVRVRIRSTGGNLPTKAQLVVGFEGDRYDRTLRILDQNNAVIDLKIPYNNPRTGVCIASQEFDDLLAKTKDFWRKTLGRGSIFNVPEKRVNDAAKMWWAYSLLLTDKINGHLEPHDGSGVYDLIYGYSAEKYALLLDRFGDHDRAAEVIDTLLQFQQPDGLYTQNFGLPDQGMLMLAIAEHYRFTGDSRWLRRKAHNLIAAGNWILEKRTNTPKTGVTKGLIKWRPYCDFPSETFNYFGNITSCIGLESAAEVLRDIGHTEDAERFEQSARAYRADVLASMDNAAFVQDGFTILPLEPDTHRLWNDSAKKATDYYGLSSSTMLETDFLAPDDKRCKWIWEALERDALFAGVTRFQKGLDHAYTYGYLRTMLRRGDAKKVILGFYTMMAAGMTRGTFSPVECTMDHLTGYNCQTLPHLYSCTVQLDTLRMMLLREDGDVLRIGEAIPRDWLCDGKTVSAKKAPTLFGDLSFTITSAVQKGEINVKLSSPTRHAPKKVELKLRHPEGKAIKAVFVDGKPWKRFGNEFVELDPRSKQLSVKVLYQ